MDNRIKCSVNNCEYWKNGNVCDASSICVSAGQDANNAFTASTGAIQSFTTHTPSDCSCNTFCSTFKPKNS